jgi:hypothetical protein
MRRRSPRAPSFPLGDAVDRALTIYQQESIHPAPAEAVAKALGYSNANNGAAKQALATLKMYGLLESRGAGKLAISQEVQSFKLAPSEDQRRDLLIGFLKTPKVFQELLDHYPNGLPSDETLTHQLVVEMGFAEPTARDVVASFRESVDLTRYFAQQSNLPPTDEPSSPEAGKAPTGAQHQAYGPGSVAASTISQSGVPPREGLDDPIPVRLRGGRKAWITLPTPFYEADKKTLKAQIDLLVSDDADDVDLEDQTGE